MCYYCDITQNATLKIKKLHPEAKLPSKREEDSGYDLYGIINEEFILLSKGENIIIPTGIAMEFPQGLGFVICNRSSVGTKCTIVGAHIVDSGYRGEVKLDLHNVSDRYIFITDLTIEDLKGKIQEIKKRFPPHITIYGITEKVFSKIPFIIPKSKALTQGIIIPTLHLPIEVAEELSSSLREDGSFGSTNENKLIHK